MVWSVIVSAPKGIYSRWPEPRPESVIAVRVVSDSVKYMRFSVPNIPTSVLSNSALRKAQSVSSPEAVQRIVSFLSLGNAAVLTGAGVSVDSGVKAYRGKDGRYMNPTYKCAHHLTVPSVPHLLTLTLRAVSAEFSGRFSWAFNHL
jgi:hypothetical protein